LPSDNRTNTGGVKRVIHPRYIAALILFIITIPSAGALELTTVKVADGFSDPLFVTSPAGDSSRLFVVEQNTARIRIIKNGTVLPTPFLDLNSKAGSGGEQGLLGMAFHPNYSSNGYFYVNYTDNSGDTVIARYTVSTNPDVADPDSEMILMEVDQPFSNHNGGMLAFSPNDGYLYIGLGDGGSSFDPGNRAQDGQNVLGKIHRIDVGNGDMFAPAPNNPFDGDAGFLDSIWALGLRNPWRFSFDRLNGDLYTADVGQSAREEINIQSGDTTGGENYGWRCMEGFTCTDVPRCTCNSGSLTLPVHDYSHSGGNCSVTGGYVYRGSAIPELDGTYFFADYCTGRIWSFVWQGDSVTQLQERTSELAPETGEDINNITSFGEDDNGEIYIVDKDGEIFKIAEASSPTPTPTPTPTPAPSDPELTGFVPGTAGTTNSLGVTGASPGSRVEFYYSTRSGGTTINIGPCRGETLQMSRARQIGTATADSQGNASIDVRISRRARGTYFTQAAVTFGSTCLITDRVSQSIGRSRGGSRPGGGSTRPSRGSRWRRR